VICIAAITITGTSISTMFSQDRQQAVRRRLTTFTGWTGWPASLPSFGRSSSLATPTLSLAGVESAKNGRGQAAAKTTGRSRQPVAAPSLDLSLAKEQAPC